MAGSGLIVLPATGRIIKIIRITRIIRIIRVIRVVRVVRFIRVIRLIGLIRIDRVSAAGCAGRVERAATQRSRGRVCTCLYLSLFRPVLCTHTLSFSLSLLCSIETSRITGKWWPAITV